MYPRLVLLQKLLHHNGTLVISIGYQEAFNLMSVVKELFAVKQIVCVPVQTSGGKPSGSFNYQHEFLIFILPIDFEANPMSFTGGQERTPFEGLTLATFNKTQRPNQAYPIFINTDTNTIECLGESLAERIKNGSYFGDLNEFSYTLKEAPEGTVAVWPVTSKGKDCVWRLTPKRLLHDWKKGYIKVSLNRQKSSKNKYSIQYLPEGVIKKIENGILKVNGKEANAPTLTFDENRTDGSDIPTLWLERNFYSVKGTTLLSEIFDKKAFDYPKPLQFITEVLMALTDSDDIILDSFAGSGTTAHAVLNLNKTDGGNRQFILVEMEDYAETITAERVRRVIDGYGTQEGTGGGFSYYELGPALFTEDNLLNETVPLARIREYIWYSETRTAYRTPHRNAEPSPAPSPAGEDGIETPHFLGKLFDTAYYFYYEPNELTTLDYEFLSTVQTPAEQYVVYADNCLIAREWLQQRRIIFKKIPRDISRF